MNSFRLEWHEGCTCQACLDLVVDVNGKQIALGMHTACMKCGRRDCGRALNHNSICTNSNVKEQLNQTPPQILKFAA